MKDFQPSYIHKAIHKADFRLPEWIVTNRSGGYAMGTSKLINTRKYHTLLCASTDSLWRINLFNSVEESVENKEQNVRFFLDSNDYGDTIYPAGYKFIEYFLPRPYPSFIFQFENGMLLEKSIMMHPEKNITMISYTSHKNRYSVPLELTLRFKLSMRDHHYVNSPGTFGSSVHTGLAGSVPTTNGDKIFFDAKNDTDICQAHISRKNGNGNVCLNANIYGFQGKVTVDPVVFRNVYYIIEDFRGYDSREDLFSPFIHHFDLLPGKTIEILLSDSEINDLTKIMGEIKKRYKALGKIDSPAYKAFKMKREIPFKEETYPHLLEQMLEDFRIKRDIIAGYPWFSCWGRDSMISLEAFAIKHESDRSEKEFIFDLLNSYGNEMQNGVLPNVKGENREGRNYDTVDASLLYVNRVFESFNFFNENEKTTLFNHCKEIILNYAMNPNLPFYMDNQDGLLSLRKNSGKALTWMDVKINGIPITPRYGKPIEINALWFNALKMIRTMMEHLDLDKISNPVYSLNTNEIDSLTDIVKRNMEKFFKNNIWYDRIEEGKVVQEIRPNFVIALSLPFDFTDKTGLESGRKLAERELLTPYGLRSLSKGSPMYRGTYMGNQKERDACYHQGTVWTWLLLPYARLLLKTEKDPEERLDQLTSELKRGILIGMFSSVAEIWDGDNPSIPKGAPAQAWSVAALYCIEKMREKSKTQ